jgi:hypothetical protein
VAVDQKVYHDILKFNFDILKQLPWYITIIIFYICIAMKNTAKNICGQTKWNIIKKCLFYPYFFKGSKFRVKLIIK